MVGAQRQPWVNAESVLLNPEKGSTVGERLQRFELFLILLTQGCRCAPTIGLQLANAFGVLFLIRLCHYRNRVCFAEPVKLQIHFYAKSLK